MITPLRLDASYGSGLAVEIDTIDDLALAAAALDLHPPRPVVVVVGGAGGLPEADENRLAMLFARGIEPVLDRFRAVAVDGGTKAGVMQIAGEARAASGASYPLIGVVVAGKVQLPGRPRTGDHRAVLEPHHSHFVIVPGEEWGEESSWIAYFASLLAQGRPTVTVLLNGGDIAYDDAACSVRERRPVIVVAGSGRTADALASAVQGKPSPARARKLAASGLIRSVPVDQPMALNGILEEVLRGGPEETRRKA